MSERNSMHQKSHDAVSLARMRSHPLEGCSKKPGEGIIRRHPLVASGSLLSQYDKTVTTIYEAFLKTLREHGDRNYLGTLDTALGSYFWLSYREFEQITEKLSSALCSIGLEEKDCIGLFSVNRMEWVAAEYSCYRVNFITVPLYDTLGSEATIFICNQTELKCVFATEDKISSLLEYKQSLPFLSHIVIMKNKNDKNFLSPILVEKAKLLNVSLVYFDEMLKIGEKNPVEARPPLSTDYYTICYTSGTTGLPKGVMLTHASMIAVVSGVRVMVERKLIFNIDKYQTHISYLPLAHIFERVVFTTLMATGASIGFYRGDTLKLLDDLVILKPSVFVTVPRLFNKLYAKIITGVKEKGFISRFLFKLALKSKLRNLPNGSYSHWLWDWIVFSKIKAKLGGRVSAMLTGSAPISTEVTSFLKVAFASPIFEGYGQTETSAASFLTEATDFIGGHVGVPNPANEIKLVDVPEMGYTSDDLKCQRGEICIRGPMVFSGYYKDPERTAETVDADGWVHTGDIGEWTELYQLRLIDRKKNIFKLSQGEYVAPEKIENHLIQSPFIEQIFVTGNPLRASLVAIVVPDKELALKWDNGNKPFEEVCGDEGFKEHLLKEITKFSRSQKILKGFEIPKAIYIEPEPFALENGLLTTTFKLKRFEAERRYKSVVDSLYQTIEETF